MKGVGKFRFSGNLASQGTTTQVNDTSDVADKLKPNLYKFNLISPNF